MEARVDGQGDSFTLFFPELVDVEIWVWQLDAGEHVVSAPRLLNRENFPGGWDALCGAETCNGIFDPRGEVYALLYGGREDGEGVARCSGTRETVWAWKRTWPCARRWQYAMRLIRKESAEDEGWHAASRTAAADG